MGSTKVVIGCVLVCLIAISGTSFSLDETHGEPKPSVSFGGFVDTYYAYDFGAAAGKDRPLTTTASRHNEFTINLAFLEAKLSSQEVRARLALQAGTSVHANYIGETTGSSPAEGSLLQHLQEAVVGYQLAKEVWVDAGVYLSHIGLETFISRDNWTYTRSFIADFSPYYETGVKLTYQPQQAWTLQWHLLNGWQNILETNSNKAVGAQVSYSPSPSLNITYNTFFGEETGALWRFFNDFIIKVATSDRLQLAASVDVGFQRRPGGSSVSSWYGYAAFLRYQLLPKVSITGRVERYSDPDRVIAQPVNPVTAFVADGASVNVDYEPVKNVAWRNEIRGMMAKDPIFTKAEGFGKNSWLAVTSLAVSF